MENKNTLFGIYYDWWKNIDKFLFSLIVLLFSTGLFFSLVSTSLIASDKLDTNDYQFFFKHLVFILLGIIIIFVLSSIKKEQLLKYSSLLFFLSLIFLILVPIIGVEVKGSKRWIDLYFLPRFQPIELVKPFLIIFISLILCSRKFSNIYISFIDSETGTYNFQSDRALESITSGGFFGKGIGEGTLKNRVPEAHTDYIISVISEEFGVIAIILIFLLFLVFIYSVFKKVNFENDETIKLILVGSVSLILMQTIIHIGVNIRLFPTTGMTLPFISYGGSSIISISILSGIILNFTKRNLN